MWIRQLDVADCAGIKAASVSLQPGLNVLHGPNELGKSTLVKAIRAALMLPAGSTAADSLRSWNLDAAPCVALTFEQEEQRVWRVHKRFGKSGSHTYLDFSRDGQDFSQEGRGREVEGSLQNILRWGIEPPGGKGGKRGMPDSFIATALLGDQRHIDAILEASLVDDPNASGRERLTGALLTDALQALAEDPRLKQVLATVQERVSEAFTPTGGKKMAKGAPFKVLDAELKAAELNEQESQRQLEETKAARRRVAELRWQTLDAQASAESAERVFEAVKKRVATAESLATAEDALQKAQAQVRSKDKKVAEAAAAAKEVETLQKRLSAAEQALAAVQPLAKAAAERVQQLESGDAEQGRRLREQEAKNRQLKLTQQKVELEAKTSAARAIAEAEAAVRTQSADVEQRTKTLEEQRNLLADAKAKNAEDAKQIEALERQRACARYLSVKERAEALAAERDAAKAQAKLAQSLEEQAEAARAKAKALNAPARTELDELKQLHADSRVANAKLAVGLSLEFMPENAGTAAVAQDGETSQRRFDAGRLLHLEAERELRLAIDGVGVVEVRGGGRDLQAEAKAATERWQQFADALFSRAGVTASAELEAKRQEADQLQAAADQHDNDAKQARVRSEDVDELERRAAVAQAEAAQCQQAAAKRMDAGTSVGEYVKANPDLRDESELAPKIESLKEEAHERDSLAATLASKTETDAAQLEALRQDLAGKQQALRAATEEDDEWRKVLAEAESDRQRLDDATAKADAELKAVQAEATAAAEDAREALAKITEEESAKAKAKDEAAESLQNAQTALAKLQGEAEALRTAAEPLDLSALQAARDEKQAALDALSAVDEACDLAELERLANAAANEADSLRQELNTAQGALGQVGGQRIEEQAEQAKDALAALARREHELEVEYGGWKLLLDTLAEAEKAEASHLGAALVKPVSERMAALTGGRYGEVGIGPQLDATGIRLGDDERSINDVSVGTREQIALLLRLAVAEALGSFVILDDHLTQSDPDRMAWLRGLLAEAAQKIQIVVMTCHPSAYLTGDLATNAHAVDLTERIERHSVDA